MGKALRTSSSGSSTTPTPKVIQPTGNQSKISNATWKGWADSPLCENLGASCSVRPARDFARRICRSRSEEHTSELQSLMRISYAVFCLKKKKKKQKKYLILEQTVKKNNVRVRNITVLLVETTQIPHNENI